MAECKIIKCTCKHEGQDALYGNGMRVFNPTGKGNDQGSGYICTVCGKTSGGNSKSRK